jgi:hypothetical protein
MDTQYSFINMNVKIWISKKIYTNDPTLTKPSNVSPFINGVKKLRNENMTFVVSPQDRTPVLTGAALDVKSGARTRNNAISCLGSPNPRSKGPAGM